MTPEQHGSKTEGRGEQLRHVDPDPLRNVLLQIAADDSTGKWGRWAREALAAEPGRGDDAHPERGLSMEAFARIAPTSDLPARDAIERAMEALRPFASLANRVDALESSEGPSSEYDDISGVMYGDLVDARNALACLAVELSQPLSQGNGEAVEWPTWQQGWTDILHEVLENYEFRDPDHTPNDFEHMMLEDFGTELLQAIHEKGVAVNAGKELPTLPDNDAYFTPDLARKIIAAYQEIIKHSAAPPSQPEGVREALEAAKCTLAAYQAHGAPHAFIGDISLQKVYALIDGALITTPSRGLVEAAEWHEKRAQELSGLNDGLESIDKTGLHIMWHRDCATSLRTLSAKGGAG